MSIRPILRIIRRSIFILLAAGICALALYALAQSSFAAQLAIGMNTAGPLIALNELAQGASGNATRARSTLGLSAGLTQVIRDAVVLAILIALVVSIDRALRRKKKKRTR
jgi:hypothetical protein